MKKSSWRLVANRAIATLVICGVSAVFIVTAWQQLRLDYKYSDILLVSRTLQFNAVKTGNRLPTYVAMAGDIVSSGVCRADILKSGLTAILTDLDTHSPDRDYDAWAGSVKGANAYIQHALTCLPTDGNLWVRYAMIEQTTAEQPGKLSALLAMSQKLAPAEKKILSARLRLYNRVSGKTLENARKTVMADLLNAERYQAGLLAEVVKQPSKRFRPYIDAAVAACGEDCNNKRRGFLH